MCYRSEAMIPKTWNLLFSGSAKQPADYSEDSSATQPAGDLTMVSISLCLFARLPLEIWRWLVGLLSYSDVAACSCSTSHEDTKRFLIGCMRRRCCVSTFIRLLVPLEYGVMGFLDDFWNESQGSEM